MHEEEARAKVRQPEVKLVELVELNCAGVSRGTGQEQSWKEGSFFTF